MGHTFQFPFVPIQVINLNTAHCLRIAHCDPIQKRLCEILVRCLYETCENNHEKADIDG